MAKKALVEGLILVGMGIMAIIECVRLAIRVGHPGHHDVLGPIGYALIIGIFLLITGVAYLFSQGREKPVIKEPAAGKESGALLKVAGVVGILTLSGFLMTIIGYLLASVVFFVLVSRVLGVKSWLFNIIYSVALALIFQLIFGNLLGVVLPQGYIDINIPIPGF